MESSKDKKEEIAQDIIDLVIARLETVPQNVRLSVGNEGSFEVKELIERIKANDEIGKKMIEMQLAYLRALKDLAQTDNVIPHN